MYKTYLADGVYAQWDGMHIVLTTEDGISATNTIAMDEEVLQAFDEFVEKLKNTLDN